MKTFDVEAAIAKMAAHASFGEFGIAAAKGERTRRFSASAWLFALVLPVSGCGKGELRLTPVSGTVSVAGKPLVGAGVSFQPDGSKGNATGHIPTGSSDSAGKYELITATRKGAPAGWYKVLVFPPAVETTGGRLPEATAPYDKKYTRFETTNLLVEVKDATQPMTFDFDLRR